MKSILVTGGLGYIGSHTVVKLIKSGFKPVIVDNLSNTYRSVHKRLEDLTGVSVPFYHADVNDRKQIDEIFRNHEISAVIHFAAYKAVGESVDNPLKYYINNVGGLCTLLSSMEEAGIKNIVFSSSCTVYGEPEHSPVDESAPFKTASSPYGNTKQIGEEILKDCKQFNTVSLRYFNPIGAHESGIIGELPLGIPNNLMPFITQTAAGIRKELTVFGNDYNTKDGTCIRDYIHVVDLAGAHVKALDYINENPGNQFEVFNIGTGKGYTVLEIIHEFEKTNGIKLNYAIGKRRSGDVEKVWADNKKALDILNWSDELGLDEMVRSAWKWQQNISESPLS